MNSDEKIDIVNNKNKKQNCNWKNCEDLFFRNKKVCIYRLSQKDPELIDS